MLLSRLNWQHYEHERVAFPVTLPPETLDGWLTLHWDKDTMERFLGHDSDMLPFTTKGNDLSVRQRIETCLTATQTAAPCSNFRLRLADSGDVETIFRLVRGLADFEKEPDAVNMTIDHYSSDGFHAEQPLFYCLLLDFWEEGQWYACGMAFCYVACKYNVGRFLYLEDLFLEESYRGKGAGTFIMRILAAMALSLDSVRLVWQALDWNTPALEFYDKIGAKVVDGLLTTRFAGHTLKAFSSSAVCE